MNKNMFKITNTSTVGILSIGVILAVFIVSLTGSI